MLEDFNAKVGREDMFKPTHTIENESLLEIINDNGVGRVKFDTSKTTESKVRRSHFAKSINILGHLQMGKSTMRLTIIW
jgi:hypothetical protein